MYEIFHAYQIKGFDINFVRDCIVVLGNRSPCAAIARLAPNLHALISQLCNCPLSAPLSRGKKIALRALTVYDTHRAV